MVWSGWIGAVVQTVFVVAVTHIFTKYQIGYDVLNEGKASGGGDAEELRLSRRSFGSVPVEEVEEFWNRQPCNSGWSFEGVEEGSVEYFEMVRNKKFFVESHIPAFADFKKWRGKSVLEIGGGICTTAVEFAQHGANVTVVDLSQSSVDICKKRFALLGLHATVIHANAEQLQQILPPDSRFDLIWSFGVLHHTPHPQRVVSTLPSFLARNGEVRLMLYSKFSYKLFQTFRDTNTWRLADADTIMAYYSEAQEGSPVTYTFTFDEVRDLLSGYDIIDMRKDHIFRFDVEQYKNNKYVVAEEFRGMPEQDFHALEKELGWHTLITAKWREEER
eukprot:CAMPEP_0113893168 /NCGR_PEP_ID=MMETSP0780_2-20120614/15910_1 /TAXON_ID=652834 /ORGANISM="Palpitomonas bilix" /LENGTH=331 /DNA_ID=CAMNT_0000883363 /DNA_START=297 /DNA_END=1292 /DNA_ORIENTATION=- /assembly_acc=CAM_ASM_000599